MPSFDPSTVTAAELHTLAVARDPMLIANHIWWAVVDAIREAGKGMYSVEYQRLPPLPKSDYVLLSNALTARGFGVTTWSISDHANGDRIYWFTLSW